MTSGEHDSLIRRQFGASAAGYRTSASHARGRSLTRLLELTAPGKDWIVLDVATGAGHTAATLAPHVATVIAGDMTPEMLAQARIVAREKSLANVIFVRESAQALSYRPGAFELVTCRVAAHHFPDPALFVAECVRVLKPGGVLAVIDNIVPDDEDAARWLNDFERQRDPSHARCLSLAQWRGAFSDRGLALEHVEVSSKWFDFHDWMRRMNVQQARIEQLARRLLDAPDSVRTFWHPERVDGKVRLALQEAILLARAPG